MCELEQSQARPQMIVKSTVAGVISNLFVQTVHTSKFFKNFFCFVKTLLKVSSPLSSFPNTWYDFFLPTKM